MRNSNSEVPLRSAVNVSSAGTEVSAAMAGATLTATFPGRSLVPMAAWVSCSMYVCHDMARLPVADVDSCRSSDSCLSTAAPAIAASAAVV